MYILALYFLENKENYPPPLNYNKISIYCN